MRNRRILYCLIAALAVIVMTGTGYVGATVEEDEELAAAVAYDATKPVAPTV
jgi:hypothetical protein